MKEVIPKFFCETELKEKKNFFYSYLAQPPLFFFPEKKTIKNELNN